MFDNQTKRKWRDVTDTFTEEQRYYKDTYLEIDEVYDECVEVSLFSCETGPYEIYVSWERMYGIIYADAETAAALREEVKGVLAEAYEANPIPDSSFIRTFCETYQLDLPNDIFFDASAWFDSFF